MFKKAFLFFPALLLCVTAHAEPGGRTLLSQTLTLSVDEAAHPEARLVAALDRLAAGQVDVALAQMAKLVEEQPNFSLAHLIYGDLLQSLGGGTSGLKVNSNQKRLQALIEEARVRWAQRRDAPPSDAVPNVLLRFALREERAVLVDLKASRLYLLWSVAGRPRVLSDHYIGIGQYGIGKRREGDKRTPVGIYRITDYLNEAALQDMYDEKAALLYGVGALPISYPNLHDRLLGRTGSGIWLHGVPNQTYVRPPRSSRGCVTMANDDFTGLLKEVVPGHTLVIFSDGVKWLALEEAKRREAELTEVMDQWRDDWKRADIDAFLDHYAEDFKTEETDLAGFVDHKQRVRAELGESEINIDQLSLMEYPGEKNVVLATFRQESLHEGLRGYVRKQQYWRKNKEGRWQIFREGVDHGA